MLKKYAKIKKVKMPFISSFKNFYKTSLSIPKKILPTSPPPSLRISIKLFFEENCIHLYFKKNYYFDPNVKSKGASIKTSFSKIFHSWRGGRSWQKKTSNCYSCGPWWGGKEENAHDIFFWHNTSFNKYNFCNFLRGMNFFQILKMFNSRVSSEIMAHGNKVVQRKILHQGNAI